MSRFGFARTVAHLEQCKLVFGREVKSMIVKLQSHGRENMGTRLFISENVPQLRYRNPAIPISLQRKKVDESEVVVCFADGREDVVKTANLMPEEILAELELRYSVHSSLEDN